MTGPRRDGPLGQLRRGREWRGAYRAARLAYTGAVTTRDSLHHLLDRLSDTEVEALARIAREQGFDRPQGPNGAHEPRSFIDARQYPVLAAVWDNDDDAVFDEL